jgi:flagellar hook-length control protein FliK
VAPVATAPATAPAIPTTCPVAGPATAQAPAAPYGVRLAEAAAKVSDTITLGVRAGTSVARIQLTPASLGTIQIHLQRTADGVVARVVTEHAEAAQTLADHSDDLRQSLEQSGTTLLRLDIETSDRRGSAPQEQPTGTTGSGSSHGGDPEETEADDLTVIGPATVGGGLTTSTLVNVLA